MWITHESWRIKYNYQIKQQIVWKQMWKDELTAKRKRESTEKTWGKLIEIIRVKIKIWGREKSIKLTNNWTKQSIKEAWAVRQIARTIKKKAQSWSNWLARRDKTKIRWSRREKSWTITKKSIDKKNIRKIS